jgi:hypothetical protein
MSVAYVTKQSLTPIICGSGALEMVPGDLVRLGLDTSVDTNLPINITGVVQSPVSRVLMLNELTGCRVSGYEYLIAFVVEDLLGALSGLTDDIVLTMECVTCCEEVRDQLLARTVVEVSPASGGTITTPRGDRDHIFEVIVNANLAALTWELPLGEAMTPGKTYSLVCNHNIATLILTGFAGEVRGLALTSVSANQFCTFYCVSNVGDGVIRRP